MQTLGISDSTPRQENRLKSLFWPSIRHETDVDYVSSQGFWLCFIVAITTLVFETLQGSLFAGLFESLFFFLGGVGVRARSRFAAVTVFVAYLLSGLVLQRSTGGGFGILRIVALALLLANVRGTWLSASWRREATEPPPVPLNETFWDKLSDRLPIVLWPKTRWLFYVLAVLENVLLMVALFAPRNLMP
ncbi:MAG TPA: hypothetical protein VGV35_09655 [Bryobacteraceae bacterium]|nr:hypothetical protein [Bryobacteraceae bacterium]